MKRKYFTFLIMGVAGSGKTTVAEKLSKKLDAYFIEADNFHSKENIAKMSAGKPLNDVDRHDWLKKIKEEISKRKNLQNIVVACSALKEKYRLMLGVKNYHLIYLKIDKDTAKFRINNRKDHFMPDSLIDSQFSILEEPENCIIFKKNLNPDQIVNQIIKKQEIFY
ncbi:gluconokinase [Alphaproteobacteria bacterium]|nr:gluconokinase [Alphaproteobacteria bacterium]